MTRAVGLPLLDTCSLIYTEYTLVFHNWLHMPEARYRPQGFPVNMIGTRSASRQTSQLF